jgi:hypothetical protein
MKKVFSKISLAVIGLPMTTGIAMAAPTVELLNTSKSVGDIIQSVITWVLGFSAAIAVLFIIYGGIQYVISAGNDARVASAKKTLTFAIIGLIVIILAGAIVVFVSSTLNQIV